MLHCITLALTSFIVIQLRQLIPFRGTKLGKSNQFCNKIIIRPNIARSTTREKEAIENSSFMAFCVPAQKVKLSRNLKLQSSASHRSRKSGEGTRILDYPKITLKMYVTWAECNYPLFSCYMIIYEANYWMGELIGGWFGRGAAFCACQLETSTFGHETREHRKIELNEIWQIRINWCLSGFTHWL